MKTEQLRTIWAEIEEAMRASDARSRAAVIDEKLPELWMARYEAEEIQLSETSKDSALAQITERMRSRKSPEPETYDNGKATPEDGARVSRLARGMRSLQTPRPRRLRLALATFALLLFLTGTFWYALDLPGAPGFKNWIAGGKGSKSNQIQPLPELPESPRIVPNKPAPETRDPNTDLPRFDKSPKTAPKQAAPPKDTEVPRTNPLRSDGMLAQRIEVGKFTSVMGEPTITYLGEKKSHAALPNKTVTTAMRIETGDADKLEFRYNDGSTTTLDFNTIVEIPVESTANPKPRIQNPKSPLSRPSEIRLVQGRVWTRIAKGTAQRKYAVHTPVASAEVLGTAFSLALEKLNKGSQKAILQVKEGRVAFYNDYGRVVAEPLTESFASPNASPTEPKRIGTLTEIRLAEGSSLAVTTSRLSARDARFRLAGRYGWAGLGLDSTEGMGVKVISINRSSPGETAGLKTGDVILAINGELVSEETQAHLAILGRCDLETTIRVRRKNEELTLTLVPEPAAPFAAEIEGSLGQEFERLTLEGLAADRTSSIRQLELIASRDVSGAAFNNLGVLFELDDRLGHAIRNYQAAIRLAPRQWLYHYNLGIALRNIGNLDRSLEELTLAAGLAPNWLRSHVEVVQTLAARGRHVDALRWLDLAQRRITDSPELWALRATILARTRDLPAAREAVLRALELEPDNYSHRTLFGTLSADLGDFAAAERELGRAIEIHPGYVNAYLGLGNVYGATSRHGDAERMYRRAIELSPTSPDIRVNLANSLANQGRLEEAEVQYRKAVEVDPTLGGAHRMLGVFLNRTGRPREAEQEFKLAAEINPADAEAPYDLGNLYLSEGRTADAEAMYLRAIALRPNHFRAMNNLGQVLEQRAAFKEAEEWYRKALAANPRHLAAHTNLGGLLAKTGRKSQAEVMWRKALGLNPGPREHNNLAVLLGELNKNDEAEELYKKAILLQPGFLPALANLADLYKKLRRIDEAESVLRKLVEAAPKNPGALNQYAWFLAEENRKLDEALDVAKRAAGAAPEDPAILDTLGFIHWRRNEFAESIQVLKKATALAGSIDPSTTDIWFHLGQAYEGAGDKNSAINAHRTALRLNPKNEKVVEALKRLGGENGS